jgi:hypothetical protein
LAAIRFLQIPVFFGANAEEPYADLSLWSDPIQIMTAKDKGWHCRPWKPSFQYNKMNYNHLFIFFDGAYNRNDGSPILYVFTMGCLEIERPTKYFPLTEQEL